MQHVEGFKAGNNKRFTIFLRNKFIRSCADDGAHMSRSDKTIQLKIRRIQHRSDRWNDHDVVAKDREIVESFSCCLKDRSEAHKNDLPVTMISSQLQRIQRRIHCPDICTHRLRLNHVRPRSRNAHHVAIGDENYLRAGCNGYGVIHTAERDHANRTTRTVNQIDVWRQQFFNAVLEDRMGMAAAHLHDLQALARHGGNLLGEVECRAAGSKFLNEFHSRTSPCKYECTRSHRM